MNKKYVGIVAVSLALSIVFGGLLGIAKKESRQIVDSHNTAVSSQNSSLEDEFWNVDLIIRGTVLGEGDTYSRDAGVPIKRKFNMQITPATIRVDKVLYGETDETEITYLQHGSTDNAIESKKMVKKSEEVLLILNRTDDGTYWSYNFDDGIWRIEDGKVKSDSQSELLNSGDGKEQQLEKFISKITKAAKNKRKAND
ncbi:hypothetical protein ACFSTH_16975 [Paenibacillus yanchengensis]|uniref:DUF4367 domain-containing protein n=1 Tax=Paenibacillus yanchengensis TaxID=2035833 RepID=A0ABW4YQF4_9BACL